MRRLLLLGGGHAHIEVVRQFGLYRARAAGVECVLASPDAHTAYSGMLPGVIAGHYAAHDMLIDVAALAHSAGWRYIPQAVQALDPALRVAILADNTRLAYDVLSVDTGSVADFSQVTGAAANAVPLRPFGAFMQAWHDMLAVAVAGRLRRIAVVGAGAAGVEVALAMAYRLAQAGVPASRCGIALVSDTENILAAHAPAIRKRFERLLARWGVSLYCGSPVTLVEAGEIRTAQGGAIAADRIIWATAGGAPAWPQLAGIATDNRGFIAVDRHLRSLSNTEIFGGGDIVSMSPTPHPKSGVYAVRHGQILAANLHAALSGAALRTYVPQRTALSLISAGGKYAVASWDRWCVAGTWVWRWKNAIDRAYVAKYSAPGHGDGA